MSEYTPLIIGIIAAYISGPALITLIVYAGEYLEGVPPADRRGRALRRLAEMAKLFAAMAVLIALAVLAVAAPDVMVIGFAGLVAFAMVALIGIGIFAVVRDQITLRRD